MCMSRSTIVYFFFNATATTEIYTYCHTLSLHDALPISGISGKRGRQRGNRLAHDSPPDTPADHTGPEPGRSPAHQRTSQSAARPEAERSIHHTPNTADRKSTRLNSSH